MYSTLEDAGSMSLPPFHQLVNLPDQVNKNGTKVCVMCAHVCPFVKTRTEIKDGAHSILARDKSVCTACHELVWQVVHSKLKSSGAECARNFFHGRPSGVTRP